MNCRQIYNLARVRGGLCIRDWECHVMHGSCLPIEVEQESIYFPLLDVSHRFRSLLLPA